MLDRHRFVGMGCSGKASLHLGYDEDAPDSARCLFSNRLVVPSKDPGMTNLYPCKSRQASLTGPVLPPPAGDRPLHRRRQATQTPPASQEAPQSKVAAPPEPAW